MLDINWGRIVWELFLIGIAFYLGITWRPRYPRIPLLRVGNIIMIDGDPYEVEKYERTGTTYIERRYVFIKMSASDFYSHEQRRKKNRKY